MGRPKRDVDLQTIMHTRRFLARIINETYKGDLDPKLAGRLSYTCNVLLKSQELELIERRLDRLEAAAELKAAVDVTPPKLTGGEP